MADNENKGIEAQDRSLGAIFGDAGIPSRDELGKAQVEEEEDQAQDDQEDQLEAKETNEEDVVDEEEEVDSLDESEDEEADEDGEEDRLAKEIKRRKDTQKWAQEKSREAAELRKQIEALKESGTVTDEQLAGLEIAQDDPRLEVREQFETEFPIIQNVMKQQGDENAEEYAMAFDFMSNFDENLTQDILALPREERIPAIVAKGKTMVDDYRVIKEKGNLRDAFEAVRELAIEDYKASVEAEKEKRVMPKQSKPTKRPKMKGSSTAPNKPKKDMSLTSILKR